MRGRRVNYWAVSVIGGACFLAGLLAANLTLAQESVSVRALLIEGEIPDDPAAAEWDKVPLGTFPLAPQVHWPDRILEVTVKDVRVRAMHNGERIAIMLEYQDPTRDPHDAAALEFMVGDQKAHFAHGQEMLQVEGGPVNIWFWKNKNHKALDMSAKGFGTLKVQDKQDVTATGVYQDGAWRVVFVRALQTGDEEHDAQIRPGEFINIAFAIWDGKLLDSGDLKEKGSQKAVSSWWYFRAEPGADYFPYVYAVLAIGLAVGLEMVVVRKLKKGSPV
ncbi:MAG: ethylbenzene dehydrogenase-related protein [Nitrospirales bacterium]